MGSIKRAIKKIAQKEKGDEVFDFDVFLVCHNRLELTINCVNALYKNTTDCSFRLTVLDDSTDLTPEYFGRLSEERTHIQYLHPKLPFKSWEQLVSWGLENTDCPYIVTLNNSCLVERGWIHYALELLKENAQVAVVAGKTIKPNGVIENAGVLIFDNNVRNIGLDEPGHRYNGTYQVDAVGFNASLFRREAIKGGFDEGYYIPWGGLEDIDHCLSLRQKGWQIWYCGSGAVYHDGAATRMQDPAYWDKFLENLKRFKARWQYLMDRKQSDIKYNVVR